VKIPLALKDPHGLAVLAAVVTSTPGTVWVGHDAEANVLTLHVLDLIDEATWVAFIKEPYERLLQEIFE
jgi:multicomponent K+:H+ antiporter subunit E